MAPTPQSLALIGDIHARLDALTAVLDAIAAADIPTGLCTGDVVMRGPEPARCIARMRELGWPTVVGNTDRKVAAGSPRPLSHPASGRIGSRSWTYRELDADDLAWLAALPTLVRLSFGGARVVVIHGDADSLPYPITAETSNRDVERQLRKLEADVLVLGHTHEAMVRTRPQRHGHQPRGGRREPRPPTGSRIGRGSKPRPRASSRTWRSCARRSPRSVMTMAPPRTSGNGAAARRRAPGAGRRPVPRRPCGPRAAPTIRHGGTGSATRRTTPSASRNTHAIGVRHAPGVHAPAARDPQDLVGSERTGAQQARPHAPTSRSAT